MTKILTYQPKIVTKRLLGVLPDRSREVLVNRLGLTADKSHQTLEAIGKKHGITRERVRQIENFALGSIRKSDQYQEEFPAFLELRDALAMRGGIVEEEGFLDALDLDAPSRNHIRFLLVLGEDFTKIKEDKDFRPRWATDAALSEAIHQSLHRLHKMLTNDHLISESEMVAMLLEHANEVPDEYRSPKVAKDWLRISKRIDRNPVGDWGLVTSPNISVRGIRDYAFLVLRKNGKPMHFTDVAKAITEDFGRKAHTATCHNELIKDPRFVLVGRGLYGLTEWGFSDGVVREVIRHLLENNGPLDKQSIIEQVLKERFVKENTVLVNLQNGTYFKRLPDGKFTLA